MPGTGTRGCDRDRATSLTALCNESPAYGDIIGERGVRNVFVVIVALLMVLVMGLVMFTDVVDDGGKNLKSTVAHFLSGGPRPTGR